MTPALYILVDEVDTPELMPQPGNYKGEALGHKLSFVAKSYKEQVPFICDIQEYYDASTSRSVTVTKSGNVTHAPLSKEVSGAATSGVCYYISTSSWSCNSRPLSGVYAGSQTKSDVFFVAPVSRDTPFIEDASCTLKRDNFSFVAADAKDYEGPVTVIVTEEGKPAFGPSRI